MPLGKAHIGTDVFLGYLHRHAWVLGCIHYVYLSYLRGLTHYSHMVKVVALYTLLFLFLRQPWPLDVFSYDGSCLPILLNQSVFEFWLTARIRRCRLVCQACVPLSPLCLPYATFVSPSVSLLFPAAAALSPKLASLGSSSASLLKVP